MTAALDPKKVAETNPAVDVRKLEEVAHVRQVLESAGVLKKADYRLSPPLKPGKASAGRTVHRLSRGT